MFLTDISLKRPVFATVIIIALLTLGIVSYTSLSLDNMPDVYPTYVTVTIVLPGASPDQVEAKVTKKVEDAVGQIAGVQHLTSNISEGLASTLVEFELDKPASEALQEVRDKLSSIRGDLPEDIQEPVIAKYDSTAQPIMSLAVTGSLGNLEMSRLVEDEIGKKLSTVSGVGAINTYGNQVREIQIKLDKDKLAAYRLTPSEVANSLSTYNLDIPSGKLADESREVNLRTDGSIKSVEDFNNLLIAERNGTAIRVRDIAQVMDGVEEPESLSYFKGQAAISLDIIKQSGGNTVEIAQALKERIEDIRASLPSGVTIDIISDNSISIKNTVHSVFRTLLEGCILAIIIVYLFLGKLRITGISAVSLPTSIITTFAALKVMNYSLNLMTLIALSLSVGLLIDDAIVVLENIVRHMRLGKSPWQAAKEGTQEIGLAVMSTTLAVVAVFLPVAMVKGVIGKYLAQFGLTVVFSLLVSLFVSFTLIPVLTAQFVKKEERAPRGLAGKCLAGFNRRFAQLTESYSRALKVVLRHRAVALGIVTLVFAGSLGIFPLLKNTSIPAQDLGEINIVAGLDSGLTLTAADKTAREMESLIAGNPQVEYLYTTVKAGEINLFVKLTDKQDRQESAKEIAAEMRKSLQSLPGVNLAVNVSSGFGITGKEVVFHIQGENFAEVEKFALQAQVMKELPGAADVDISYKGGNPEIKLEVDEDKAADLGVSPAVVGDTLRTLFNGTVVGQYDGGSDRYDVRLSVADSQSRNTDSLRGIYVPGSQGPVPLNQVTQTVFATSASTIDRYDKVREIQISANLEGISSGDFNKLFLAKLEQMGIPSDIKVSVGGTEEMVGSGFLDLIIALLIGVLFIYLVLAAQFESFIDPIAILFSLPLAIIGAIWGLFVSNNEVSMTSMIGVIMLMGLVTKNAILLVDFTIQQRKRGSSLEEALLKAGDMRLRPIMMTSLAMIIGMIPTAVATSVGSEVTAPMAWVIIGGLITSTLLTLFVVPVMYTLVDDLKSLAARRRAGKTADQSL